MCASFPALLLKGLISPWFCSAISNINCVHKQVDLELYLDFPILALTATWPNYYSFKIGVAFRVGSTTFYHVLLGLSFPCAF